MNWQSSDTAVLVFTRSAREEIQHKSPALSSGRSYALWRVLQKSVKNELSTVDYKVYWWDEQLQEGNTFGEKFTHAIDHLFSIGYEQVITIGTDCPSLNARDIGRAADLLENKCGLILGPTFDGGVYLIGLQRQYWKLNKFRAIPWCESTVYEELVDYARSFGFFPQLLEKKHDIDDSQSLYHIIRSQDLNRWLKKFLFHIVSPFLFVNSFTLTKTPINVLPGSVDLRAPPFS